MSCTLGTNPLFGGCCQIVGPPVGAHRYVELNSVFHGFNAFIPNCSIYSRKVETRVGPPAAGGGGTVTQIITSLIDPGTGAFTQSIVGPNVFFDNSHVHDDPTTITHAHRDYLDGSNVVYSTYDQDLSQMVDLDTPWANILAALLAFNFNTLPVNALSINGSVSTPWFERSTPARAYNTKIVNTGFSTASLRVSAYQTTFSAPGYSAVFTPIDCILGQQPAQVGQLHPLSGDTIIIIYPAGQGFVSTP